MCLRPSDSRREVGMLVLEAIGGKVYLHRYIGGNQAFSNTSSQIMLLIRFITDANFISAEPQHIEPKAYSSSSTTYPIL